METEGKFASSRRELVMGAFIKSTGFIRHIIIVQCLLHICSCLFVCTTLCTFLLHKLQFVLGAIILMTLVVNLCSWEEAYRRDLETFKDIGDVGEIW